MSMIEGALDRLREYRRTLNKTDRIDPVGGLSADDLDVILDWASQQSAALDPDAAARLPYPARAAIRVLVLVAIIFFMIVAWKYAGA